MRGSIGVMRRRRQRTSARLILLLIAVCCAAHVATGAGFDFDLNEPAPIDDELSASDDESLASAPSEDGGVVLKFAMPTQPQPQPQACSLMGRLAQRAKTSIKLAAQKLPSYFDFDAFRSQFKRTYSAGEQLFRKSLFLRKCMDVFKARVSYRLGKSSYTQTVNKFSDKSDNEMKRMFMSAPPIEFANATSREEYARAALDEHKRREQMARADAEQAANSETESRASLFDLNNGGGGSASDDDDAGNGEVLTEAQAKRQIELMLAEEHAASMTDEQLLAQAVQDELAEAADESFSQACLEGDASGRAPRELPWPGHRGAAAESMRSETASAQPIDWSSHACFHSVYDQGDKCGKCYVMATTALAEFYKCSEQQGAQASPRKFSKDYVLDCAQKYSTANLGCAGGSMLDTLEFMARAGVYNIPGWKTKRSGALKTLREAGGAALGLDAKCPLNQFEVPFDEWGDIRVGVRAEPVQVHEWQWALQDGPIVASVQMPSQGLDTYAGGVHDGTGCESTGNWHAMLLVGFGTDARDGTHYWRFRNSWGADWGERGHFNLAMSVPAGCLAGGVRVTRV